MLRPSHFFVAALGLALFHGSLAKADGIQFIENLGQWNSKVLYKVDIPSGALFLEKDGFTYSLLERETHHHPHVQHPESTMLRGHAFRMKFEQASDAVQHAGDHKSSNYRNYFIGNDPDQWKSWVYAYAEVNYTSLYDGIDLKVYSHNGSLKYDLIIAPNANPNTVAMHYEGLDDMRVLASGDLKLTTSIMDVFEKSPVAFQVIDGLRKDVACKFKLEGKRVSFEFPNGYDENHELVIDPQLVFASYTGSTTDNFGSTATFDNNGNLYGAGTSFGSGYPVTTGAYTQPAAGNTDIGISKFSADGSTLLYSTFVGGAHAESVNSLIVNSNDELYLLGTSSSLDYPLSTTAFQSTNGRGQAVNWSALPPSGFSYGYGIEHALGCDIVITRLAADGSNILSSTFVGGTDNDGLNPNTILYYNYGDPFRGEINIDAAGNVYVASSTESADFPVTAGSAQPNIGGGRDGVVFKMNPNLSTMLWSTFIGGSSTDNAYSVQLSSSGEVVVAGGTISSNFPTTSGTLFPNSLGQADGWVTKIAPNGSTFNASTFIGTNKYDQVYFVQLDPDDNIFLLGQSLGNIPTTPATVYSNPSSGQFIQKLDNSLSTVLVSTTIGTSSGSIDFSPTAFLVSNCYQIFLSGWGGSTNREVGNATQSTTVGLPISSDAFQSTTDGSDFYLMMLEKNVESLIYGTFFGGAQSDEHVDGGTSRFDKNGVVYQAVCAGCGNHDDFPTTPGAWSNTNNSSNCNLGVFKFDLNQVIAVPAFNVLLENCEYPLEVEFSNTSSGANTFLWDYGDGVVSTAFDGSHFYADPGSYEVSLLASDSAGCLTPDSATLQFDIPIPPVILAFGTDTICALDTVPLGVDGVGIASYEWIPPGSLDDPYSTQPNANPTETTVYTVLATDSIGCTVSQEVIVYVSDPPPLDAGEDAYLQPGVYGELTPNVNPGNIVEWTPPEGLSCTDCPNPIANPEETTTYYILVTDELGCTNTDSVIVYAYPTIYVPNAFTPGGNNKNPIFYAYGRGIADFTLTIYSRWGQVIFQSTDLDTGWDGTMNGTDVQTGVYIWSLKYTTDIEPLTIHTDIGHVTLLRNVY
ncbi:MAG: gliding motility-associated C-terminal domain-containing protein [Flavobacteriales bacterium]|nr:gliding motility-associated C-terminal domain-containing protein [Flavobacteriales bacterium]